MTRFGIVISKLLERCIIALVLGLGVGVGLGLTQQHALELAHAEQPVASQAQASEAPSSGKADDFNFFSDKPVESKDIVVLPPEKSKWLTVGGPAALLTFMVGILLLTWRLIPFDKHSVDINLRNFPPAAKRGMALAVVLFGIAFAFGASELWYQLQFFGSSADFVASMSLGKLIVMTHAHLFGFTTAFFIVGIPFSMQFNHIKLYQWIFPIGLAACLTDVMSWWGIKYVAHSFEYVSMVCAVLFSVTYMWMLIGLLRTLAFPEVIWASDKDKAARAQKLGKNGN
ncbi:MAG TPA: hypothetical protein VFX23_06160 [Limnobacter sp.]|uniref:hypothetical protein n=1 Tax=Limnobacter sp. TaxID=2003368 RepID=UPI002E31B96B|nr:hypothetical protein [Limnobacter sp.]HEX5485562.1 hypothetical protein [Limnobacter sp.]